MNSDPTKSGFRLSNRWGAMICVAAQAMIFLGACSSNKHEDAHPIATDASSIPQEYKMDKNAPEGLSFTLSETTAPNEELIRPRLVTGEELSAQERADLLGRLPPLPDEAANQKDFAFRARSKPAPRPGETIESAFPPDATLPPPPGATDGPMELLRFAPDGDVELAPKLSVTFSQPVVAVSGQEDAAKTVPVKIEPAVDGKWRWIGTRTALFEPTGERFPMATDYKVTVDPALKSATGNELNQAESWTFSTPALKVVRAHPTGTTQPLKPLIFMQFNQKIDQTNILDSLRLLANDASTELLLASEAEIQTDKVVPRLIDNARPGHWVAFRPARELKPATTIQINLAKGAPSIEGPKLSEGGTAGNFRTYDPLRVLRQSCDSTHPCTPGAGWYISFNNPLDDDDFSADKVSISPEIEGVEIRAQHGALYIKGNSKARTKYKVTLDASLKDKFGQTLGKNTELTFDVGPAYPIFGSSAGAMSVLDPALDGHFPIFSVNYDKLRLRAYRVTPADWEKYLAFTYQRHRYRNNGDGGATPPGKLVINKVVEIDSKPDEMTHTLIDLGEALNENGHGQLVVMLTEEKSDEEPPPSRPGYYRGYRDILTWVQATDIALDAFVSGSELLAWASRLKDGAPLKGVDISLSHTGDDVAKTDATGLRNLTLPKVGSAGKSPNAGRILIAMHGEDVAMLPERQHTWAGMVSNWVQQPENVQLLWHIFDDRGMYQPGETVNIKGWLREAKPTRENRLGMVDISTVKYRVSGPRGNQLSEGSAKVDANGGFDLNFELSDDVNLGQAMVTIYTEAARTPGTAYHSFKIQEFRRPEFEVSVSQSGEPHFIGSTSTLSVAANYYAGGALTGAPVAWNVSSQEGNYTPPGHSDFIFGRWRPWWFHWHPNTDNPSQTESFKSHTDASGEQHLKIKFNQANPALPMVVDASASVSDVNRQNWSGSTHLLVHPSAQYVGIRSQTNYVGEGEPFKIDAIVTNLEGDILSGKEVVVSATRMDWRYENGTYKEVDAESLACTLTSAEEAQTCTFKPEKGGQWKITATTLDERGRPNMSQAQVWVGGGERPPSRTMEKGEVQLIPEKESYEAGERAKLMVIAPFPGAEGLLTVRQNGVVSKERFRIKKQSHQIEVAISEADYPNVHVQVDLVGKEARTTQSGEARPDAPAKPAYASGQLTLKVPPKNRTLDVAIAPEKARMNPGAKTHINVKVTDAAGKAVANSQVAIVAVDEAILALSGYTLADPIESFYPDQPANVTDFYLQQYLLLATADEAQEAAANAEGFGGAEMKRSMAPPPMMDRPRPSPAARGGAMAEMDGAPMEMALGAMANSSAGGASGPASAPIALRKDFRALALFAPAVQTNAKGEAQVELALPDNLTRYRLMAVAVAGADQFGKSEATLTARLPLMVRPSPPRFLNFGDRFELPVVLQNQTDAPMQVKVAARAANLTFGKAPGRLVEVPANDRVEVRFKAVSDMAGTAVIQVAAASGSAADAATNELPVWTPATTEAFATYGTVDKNGAIMTQPVAPPSDSLSQFGGLEVTTSSTALQGLTDALLYLANYPYESAESIGSRIMAIAALRDVLQAFEAEKLPSEAELIATVERDVVELGKLQRPDGGFYLWSRYDYFRYPFTEVHINHALQRAKLKGFEVPDAILNRSKSFLHNIRAYIPAHYSKLARNTVMAYAYYVLDLMGESVHAKALELANEKPGEAISLEAIGWLMNTLEDAPEADARVKELTRYVQNRVDETSGNAQFTTDYGGTDHVLMHSLRRTDAILLDAWIANHPKSDLIPKLVRGLLAHRVRGHWRNTQENVFVLLALDRYFQAYEKTTPEFVANMWLGDGFVGGHSFKGRSNDYQKASIPMKSLIEKSGEDKAADLVIQKDGEGRLYYRIGMSYALKSLKLEPADYGFTVERSYEGVDDPADVTQREDGTWEVRNGSRVRVRLTMVAPARRYHVALVDPLPAGLEPLNPALAVTEPIPADANAAKPASPYWWWYRPWYSHQNLRDERAEAFAPYLGAGVHEYTYVTRATTPGEFVVPPTKAEEMYSPETFGRTGTARVIVR
ncbi:Ig-like domain-containing alpha-2-macroglobulin family protein [Bradymonas sediminis]|uniref:Alpha-2-macroglobulin n=1 Tax=Bradymonas sediminis TaxID=1548548 RepID=A0A2Z4FK81_9DELT|nr:Ig-like domain-containing alpha-2-macroglobulin family protein [Bradymonas sediminis]AWV89353.1 hypothetical protein DN745_08395 [Bradymonas sediminis]